MRFYKYNARNLRLDMDLRSIVGRALRKAKLGSSLLKQYPVSETHNPACWSTGDNTKPTKDR